MKSFNTVYNTSKNQVLENRAKLYEADKIKVVNILKEEYMIKGKILNLPVTKQKMLAKKVYEYWSPKNGLTTAGKKLINEHIINLTPNSSTSDIKRYIQNETKKNIDLITEAFKNNNVKVIIETFKEDIQSKIQKKLYENSIRNIMWDIVSDKLKMSD